MITADTSAFDKSIDEYKELLTAGLEKAVKTFALDAVKSFISSTPYGDSRAYQTLYELRNANDPRYPLQEGMARSNWQISVSYPDSNTVYRSDSFQAPKALQDAGRELSTYILGEDVYIYNTAPYINMLEGNYSKQTAGKGITSPAMQIVSGLYSSGAKFRDNLN